MTGMTEIFYGFILIEDDSPVGRDVFKDFILKESTNKSDNGGTYQYKGHWRHSGCYWMVLE